VSQTLGLPSASGQFFFQNDGVELAAYLARPAPSAAGGARRNGLVICHGFPVNTPGGGPEKGFSQLADRLASESGWPVLTFSFRGTAPSGGNFSLGGWLSDLRAAVRLMRAESGGVSRVWLCGFAAGGALAICAAGSDPSIGGVAAFAAPADFADRANDARRFVAQARAVGVIRDPWFPRDLEAWARELRTIRPLEQIARIPPRPILLVHGANDEVVPVLDSRALADAAEGQVELRVLAGAGHRLRNDPRAIALLIGWLDSQAG